MLCGRLVLVGETCNKIADFGQLIAQKCLMAGLCPDPRSPDHLAVIRGRRGLRIGKGKKGREGEDVKA